MSLNSSADKLNETQKITTTAKFANTLENITTPSEELPFFAQDINFSVDIMSTLNTYVCSILLQ